MKKKILVVASHPDDEILGCGGTIAKLSKSGNIVKTIILTKGISSRFDSNKNEIIKLQDKLNKSSKAG